MNNIIIRKKMVAPISLIKGTGNIILSGGVGASVTVIDNLTSTSKTDALSANMGRYLKELVDKPVEIDWYAISGKPSWIGSSKPTYTADEVGAVAPRTEVSFTKVITTGGGFINQNYGYNVQMSVGANKAQMWTDHKVLEINNWNSACGDSGVRLVMGNNGVNLRGIWMIGDVAMRNSLRVGSDGYADAYGSDCKFAVSGKSALFEETIFAKGNITIYGSTGTGYSSYSRIDYISEYFSISNLNKNFRLIMTPENVVQITGGGLNVSGDTYLGGSICLAGDEHDNIESTKNQNGILQNWYGANASIRHALKFKWYDENFQIGAIRGGSTEIRAFGITYNNDKLLVAFEREKTVVFGDLQPQGSLNMGGSNQINQHGGYDHLAINYYCQGVRKGVHIFNGVGGTIATFGAQGNDELRLAGRIDLPDNSTSYIAGAMDDANAIQCFRQTQYSFHPNMVMKSRTNNRVVLGGIDEEIGFYCYNSNRVETSDNGYDDRLIYHSHNKNWDIKASNMVQLDAPTAQVTGQLLVRGNIVAYNTSDKRLKKDITPASSAYCLNTINRLNPVCYKWDKSKGKYTDNLTDGLEFGLIAQEVEEVVPEMVKSIYDGEYKGIDYKQAIPFLIGAVKELSKQIKKLRNEHIK